MTTTPCMRGCLCLVALLLAAVAASGRAEPLPRQVLFAGGETIVPYEDENGEVQPRVVTSFRIPSLIEIDGAVLAIADARYNKGSDHSFIETASKLSIDGGLTWTTQIAIKNKRVDYNFSRVMDPTVVVKGKKAYVLVGSWNESSTSWSQQGNGDDWDALIAVGEIRRETKDGKERAWMEWGKPTSVKHTIPEHILGGKGSQFFGGVGTGLLMKNGTILFPVQVSNVWGGYTSSILYSPDDGATWHFGTGTTVNGCSENNIIEWDGNLMMNSRCGSGYRMVFETSDMGSTWTETALSRVWGSSPKRDGSGCQGSFITITAAGKRGMLHSAPKNVQGRDRLLLWLSDGDRIAEIGQISDGDTMTGYSSLQYIDGNLHVLYEIPVHAIDDLNRTLVLQPLPEFTRRVESVLAEWDAQDRLLASAGVPTNGLVALLSDRADGSVWRDVYGAVDADTTNAWKVANGFQFSGGRFGGARWPVVRQGQFQRFYFTRWRFTLAATLTVDEMTARNWNSPLGAALDESGEAKVLGLRYAIDGVWNPVYGYIYDRLSGAVAERRAYHVALVFDDGVGRVYVDGKALDGAPQRLRFIEATEAAIDHFYIGGYAHGELDRDCRSTVRNVMLYNRVLIEEEINALYMNHAKIRTMHEQPSK